MTSRRGAVKINPVTGKMEAVTETDLTKHRDGSLMVDDKYVNMAKELGLGGAAGESFPGLVCRIMCFCATEECWRLLPEAMF